ncbi:CYP710A1 protein [Hibiscus syriacus]|uniref:C-22 sterol desaturase n=1 Tax=Hibiscus syriacus TaxID=106335 RepID=A0A6A3AW70_HIBSY|nr:CYP710A1 protein [Hibiscus syriacus]
MIFLTGQDHKDLRSHIAPNFTPRELSTYTELQQLIILKHLESLERLSEASPAEGIPLRLFVRDLNLETSQTEFVGRYLSSEARERFRVDYNDFNAGLMTIPFDLPGFAFQKAKLRCQRMVKMLIDCVSQSKTRMLEEKLREMKYTQAVAHEVVSYRPPVTLVPHIVKEFQLTESYTIPKGTIVFPSVYESSFQGFTEADRFEPERFFDKRQEEVIFRRNYLAFGAGAHQCVGQRYALNHLVLFIAMFVTLLDFKRDRADS